MSTQESKINNGGRVAGRIDFPRRWEAARLYWLAMRTPANVVGLGLTGTGNRATATTPVLQEDVRILAGVTDLDASLVSMKDASERAIFSNDDTLIKQFFGKRLLSRNLLHHRPPFLLKRGNHITADALGAGGETDGQLIFLCDPVNARKQVVEIPEDAYPFSMVLSAGLAGTANEVKRVETQINRSRSTLVWGAGSDLRNVSIRIRDAEGEYWMNDPIPIWAVCGDPSTISAGSNLSSVPVSFADLAAVQTYLTTLRAGIETRLDEIEAGESQIITQLWPRPYLIPPGGSLQVEFTNPATGMESNGNIYFNCARW